MGPGGVARGEALGPLEGGLPRWRAGTERLPRRNEVEEGAARGEASTLSVAALELERDAWADLVRSLEAEGR